MGVIKHSFHSLLRIWPLDLLYKLWKDTKGLTYKYVYCLPVHFKVKAHKKGEQVPEVLKYIVWIMDQHYKMAPEEQVVVMFDFTGAGVSHMVRNLE